MFDINKRLNLMPVPYWSNTTKISAMQRMILVYSIMYYERHESCVGDKQYDDICKKLVEYQNKYPKSWNESQYYYAMYDFDGTTGFDLPDRLKKKDRKNIERICDVVYRMWKKEGKR